MLTGNGGAETVTGAKYWKERLPQFGFGSQNF